jgi:Flp pilus assembly protein TadG
LLRWLNKAPSQAHLLGVSSLRFFRIFKRIYRIAVQPEFPRGLAMMHFCKGNIRVAIGSHLGTDVRGSVSIVMALSLIGLMGMVGLAIDYNRMSSTRQELQTLADAAVIAAATSARASQDPQTAADISLAANWAAKRRQSTAAIVVSDAGNNELLGLASTKLPMTFARILGWQTVDISVKASVVYGQGSVELALVLDTTGSMAGQPLSDLQAATKALLDSAYAPAGASDKVKVAVVPFAQYVNVGIANRNKPWMSVPANSSSTSNQCTTTSPIIGTSNCTTKTATGYNDGVPYTYTYQDCTYQYGPPVTTCGPQTSATSWNGCAGSRNHPLDNDAKVASGQPVPGVMDTWCGTEMLRLTKDRSTIDGTVASFTAGGETYIPAGLLWGWRAISPDAPFADGTAYNGAGAARKAIVLMTDGANTKSPNYPDHEGYDANKANQLMAETCAAIKAQKISVFMVAFNVTDQAAKDRLSACASSTSQFFDAPSASQLSAAFQKIGRTLAALYLKK